MNRIGHALRVLAPAVFLTGCASDFDKCFEVELQKAWEADAKAAACAEYSNFSDEQRLDTFRAWLSTISGILGEYGASSSGDLSTDEGLAVGLSTSEAEDPGVWESAEGCADSADSELVNAILDDVSDRMFSLLKESHDAEAAQALLMGADEIYKLAAEERARIATEACND